jgi:acetyl-CoA/propionyl-CoA/long-chain acyl-CoA carboxylase, biotin carboxylase, biotin carboxyl carrier protein
VELQASTGGGALMFHRILVANRGEIAVRIARTCHEMGVGVVAIHSDVDAEARHVVLADQAVHLPGVGPLETYLNVEAIIRAALESGAQAIHPGYGFLSERADVAEAVTEAGLVWIGPPPEASRAAGDKIQARRLAEAVGVAPVPGTLDPVGDAKEVLAFGERHGYPVAIKAAGGGGGRGLKVAASPGEVEAAMESAGREAQAYFGSADVYLERYLERPKHVEVQILAPRPGEATWLGARDCSMQRRHQKLVEETPPPRFAEVTPAMGEAAVAVANACGYVNAGTVEFLLDEDGRYFFLEINARLQVEHTITEEVLGIDLVAEQLRIAAGDPMSFSGRPEPRGHAIECRINAEDPARGFLPSPGTIRRYREPGGPGIRVDSGFGAGDEIPGAYDSLIAKLVAWAPTREDARRRMLRALYEYLIEGIRTTIPAHRVLLELPEFLDGSYTTRTVEGGALDALMPVTVQPDTDTPGGAAPSSVLLVHGTPVRLWNPAIAAAVSGAAGGAATEAQGAVTAPMHGTVLKVLVGEGDRIAVGDPVAVLETMKMETSVAATASGTVEAVKVQPGDVVESGQVVAVIG